MRTLSLWQPYASLIIHGEKQVETRSWKTDYRGDIAIHASLKWNLDLSGLLFEEPFRAALMAHGLPAPNKGKDWLPFGALIGTARLERVVPTIQVTQVELYDTRQQWRYDPSCSKLFITPKEALFGNYRPGRFAWCLTDYKPLAQPIPYRGQQGFFDVPEEVLFPLVYGTPQMAKAG